MTEKALYTLAVFEWRVFGHDFGNWRHVEAALWGARVISAFDTHPRVREEADFLWKLACCLADKTHCEATEGRS